MSTSVLSETASTEPASWSMRRTVGSAIAPRRALTKRSAPSTRKGRPWKGHVWIDRPRDLESVVGAGNELVCLDKRLLPGLPVRGRDGGLERTLLGPAKGGVGRPQPLRVWRVAPLLQEPKPHHVAHERSLDQTRAELVAARAGAAEEVLELRDPAPVAGHDEQPDVARVPRKALAHARQLADRVGEDLACGYLEQALRGRREPIGRREGLERIEPDQVTEVGAQREQLDPVEDGIRLHRNEQTDADLVARAEARRVATERRRQPVGERRLDLRGRAEVAEEQLKPGAPVVVGRGARRRGRGPPSRCRSGRPRARRSGTVARESAARPRSRNAARARSRARS